MGPNRGWWIVVQRCGNCGHGWWKHGRYDGEWCQHRRCRCREFVPPPVIERLGALVAHG